MTTRRQAKGIVSCVEHGDTRTMVFLSAHPAREYYVIAPKDIVAHPGDVVTYEPYGFNFGWYVSHQTAASLGGAHDVAECL